MKPITHSFVLLAFVAFFVFAAQVSAQTSAKQETPELSAEKKKAVIDEIVKAIDEQYLYQDRVEEIATHLRRKLGEGTYDEAKTAFAFSVKLTDDLRAFTKDKHFAIRHSADGSGGMFGGFRTRRLGDEENSEESNESAEGGQRRVVRVGGANSEPLDPNSQMYKMLHQQFRGSNFSMPKLEVLPGNVGYIRFEMIPPLDVAKPTLDSAMMFLSNTDAMVIDLRDCPGGVGGFISYFISYFFPQEKKLLYTRYFGADDRSDEFFTVDQLGGQRRPDVPLFVLTNQRTGSAAENLAFTLKGHGRAVTVGETTSGAGHSATLISLSDGFTAMVPIADVIHPVTKTGFDQVGVVPSVEATSAEALDRAHEAAISKLMETATGNEKKMLEGTLVELRTTRELKKNSAGNGAAALKGFVGKFGAREVFIEGDKLKYRRQGGPAIELVPTAKDTFRMRTPAGVRTAMALPNVRFERDNDGKVTGFSLVRGEEVEEFVEKSGE